MNGACIVESLFGMGWCASTARGILSCLPPCIAANR